MTCDLNLSCIRGIHSLFILNQKFLKCYINKFSRYQNHKFQNNRFLSNKLFGHLELPVKPVRNTVYYNM